MPAIAFKEWSLVCRAMEAGHQAIILRKGGIHEGREGFAFRHESFFLFPTVFHDQRERLRPEAVDLLAGPDGDRETMGGDRPAEVVIRGWATLEGGSVLTDWEQVAALADLHVWSDDVVRERFEYDGQQAIHVALVRVWRLAEPWVFPDEKRFGGCRSWIEIPEPASGWREGLVPSLSDEAFAVVRERVEGLGRRAV